MAFSLINADRSAAWQPVMGFIGIEPLNPVYAQICESRDISYEYFGAPPGKSWRCWPRIFRWLTKSRPDAVIVHSIGALLPCFLYARSRGVPVVAVEHQSNALKYRSDWFFSYLAMLLARRVVVLTPAYDRELRERLGRLYFGGKVRIIPNGIDLSRFARLDRPLGKCGAVRMGMASRFTKTKRQDVLLDVLDELRKSKPEIDWRLSLAGDGETWEAFSRTIRERRLDGYISLPGLLGEDDLIDWFRSIDIYLHASEGETLSTSLLQAMACGLPIVASDVPGIRNLLSEGQGCGVLVEEQDPNGFASAVIGLFKAPGIAAALGEAGRNLVEKRYNHAQMFSKYADLLAQLHLTRRCLCACNRPVTCPCFRPHKNTTTFIRSIFGMSRDGGARGARGGV